MIQEQQKSAAKEERQLVRKRKRKVSLLKAAVSPLWCDWVFPEGRR
jgi:hypothetical protein